MQRRSSAVQAKPAAEAYPEATVATLKAAVRTVLASLGEDVEREGLLDTPKVK
jgi:GTP cyclohydrolase I